ncbi:MAG: 5-deoxy-glucuronate isomerase [Clostridia bacterium]
MNYKKNYRPAKGLTRLCKMGECSLEILEFSIIELAPGQEIIFNTEETETAFIILSGRCSLEYDEVKWQELGSRRTVFEGKATSAYVGRRKAVRIWTSWNVKIAVVQTPIEEDTEGFVVKPEEVKTVILGKPTWKRDTHFIFDGSTPTKRLCIGEAYVDPGNWAGFPPHKHDVDNMPAEGVLEELYYFLFQPNQGFGFQRLYTADGEIDEVYVVKNDDLVEFPKGYHTTVAAPGYNSYFLWAMAGDNKGFYRSSDPEHEWVSAIENFITKNNL